MEAKTVTVIGAVNMDICGSPSKAPTLLDSNPGSIMLTPGGVGRNIAHNLRLLGVNVRLCAAVGEDSFADSLLESCLSLGIDMSLSPRIKGGRSSIYLYVTDEKGEMLIGINDMGISERIDPEYLAGIIDELNASDAVVIDGNLSAEAIGFIAENVTAPLFADPVSGIKAPKLIPALPRLCAFKPNALEAMSLTGTDTPEKAAARFSEIGIKRVFVSLGADGILACEDGRQLCLPCGDAEIINTTGCGDAAMAAIIWGSINGLSLEETARAAMKAASLTSASPCTVNPCLSALAILS